MIERAEQRVQVLDLRADALREVSRGFRKASSFERSRGKIGRSRLYLGASIVTFLLGVSASYESDATSIQLRRARKDIYAAKQQASQPQI